MQKYGGAAEGGDNIRFSLLALVDDQYQAASDELELLKREKYAIEKRMRDVEPDGWCNKVNMPTFKAFYITFTFILFFEQVNPTLFAASSEAFTTSVQSTSFGRVFAEDFGLRKLDLELNVLDLPERQLFDAWDTCVRAAMLAKISVEDEITKSVRAQVHPL